MKPMSKELINYFYDKLMDLNSELQITERLHKHIEWDIENTWCEKTMEDSREHLRECESELQELYQGIEEIEEYLAEHNVKIPRGGLK